MREYQVKTIRALDRGLEVLAHLQAARAASLHELHLATGLPKATLTRIIATLAQRGMVWQRLADGAWMTSHTLHARSPHLTDEDRLVEVASPVLERLCRAVEWPSVLAVPRLDHMAVIETNRPRAYFSHIQLGPIGFRVNMLRSAAGRAYIAFCSASEREAVLQRLRASAEPGNWMARQPALVERVIEETRRQGYGRRAADFGGHFDRPRREWDDGRDSIAVPVRAGDDVIAVVNLTWVHKVATVRQIVQSHLPRLADAAADIERRLQR